MSQRPEPASAEFNTPQLSNAGSSSDPAEGERPLWLLLWDCGGTGEMGFPLQPRSLHTHKPHVGVQVERSALAVGCQGKICTPDLPWVLCEGLGHVWNTFTFIYTHTNSSSSHN